MKNRTSSRLFLILAVILAVIPANALADTSPPPDMFQLPWEQGKAWVSYDGLDNGWRRPSGSPHNYRNGGAIDFAPRVNMTVGEDTSNDWVTAAAAGTVTVAGNCVVKIDHGNGWLTEYWHLDNIQVSAGQKVSRNQKLAVIHNNKDQQVCIGNEHPGPHLHFVFRPNVLDTRFAGWTVNYNAFTNKTTYTKGGVTVPILTPLLNVPDMQIVTRGIIDWNTQNEGSVDEYRCERWSLLLVENAKFEFNVSTSSAGLTPVIILRDADLNEIARSNGHMELTQPLGFYYLDVCSDAGTGFYNLTATKSESNGATVTPSPTLSASETPTPTQTLIASETPTPTVTVTETPSVTPSPTVSPTPSETPIPSFTPTPTFDLTGTAIAATQIAIAGTQTAVAGTSIAETQTAIAGTAISGTQTAIALTSTADFGTQTAIAGTQTAIAGTAISGTQTAIAGTAISGTQTAIALTSTANSGTQTAVVGTIIAQTQTASVGTLTAIAGTAISGTQTSIAQTSTASAGTQTAISSTLTAGAPTSTPTTIPTPTGPYVLVDAIQNTLGINQTTLVNVSLNNVPPEGYTAAEFHCVYDPGILEVSNIVPAELFGTDPASALNGPQNGSFILAIAGSQGKKATSSGTAFTFTVRGMSAGTSNIQCTARVSMGQGGLESIAYIPDSVTVFDASASPTPTQSLPAYVAGQVIASKPVTIQLFDAGNVMVVSQIANADGTFNIPVGAGTYTIVASAEGFLKAQGFVTLVGGVTATMQTVSLPAGDIDGNSVIDQFDALTIGINYNLSAPTAADLNNDGTINVLDLELLAANYRMSGALAWQ
jgi:murein DD-endopeptidase MepM/ murein hydrolase activator NlpD